MQKIFSDHAQKWQIGFGRKSRPNFQETNLPKNHKFTKAGRQERQRQKGDFPSLEAKAILKMTENQFIERFKSKSDKELERIALDSKSFIFDARYAAITLLKSRNYDSPVIASVEKDAENLKRAKRTKTLELKEQNERLIRRIRHIPIKGTGKYELENRNVLQVKRLSENGFQVRIEDNFRSDFAPVLICKTKDDSSFSCYPFLYLKSILIYGVGGTALMAVISLLGQVEKDAFVLLIPLIISIGMQLLLMPVFYFSVLNIFKDRLGKKQTTNRANRITSS